MELDSPEKRHRHHKKHKHKKHKKHRKSNKETSEKDDGSTEQEIELDQVEYNMDMTEESVTVPAEGHFLMDAEHCEGALEVIEELVEIDGNGIDTINIEEMVLENYGQDYDELDVVDVDGVDEEILEDIEEDLLEDGDESVEDEDLVNDNLADRKSQTPEESSKGRSRVKDRLKRSKDEDGGSSGEEAWLEALESGKLEEVDDELKKIKNPKLMTARQRALLERKGELQNEEAFKEELVALPTGYKETVVTEEVLQKKALKSQRRREVAAQKRETEKKRTIDRLLQKKESKIRKTETNNAAALASSAVVSQDNQISSSYSWKQTCGETLFTVPIGTNFPLVAKIAGDPPVMQRCGVQGCSNIKRYSCSKTAMPVCSLQCYKANLAQLTSCR